MPPTQLHKLHSSALAQTTGATTTLCTMHRTMCLWGCGHQMWAHGGWITTPGALYIQLRRRLASIPARLTEAALHANNIEATGRGEANEHS